MDHKLLLPGVTVLDRFIYVARGRMEARSWQLLTRGVCPEQRGRLESLLEPVPDGGGRQSLLDQLRKGPVRVSAPALVQTLERIETIRGQGIRLPRAAVPRSRMAAMARFAGTAKVSAVARLPEARRTTTLVAFVHSLEASALDDALEVLDQVPRQLFGNAGKADGNTRQRSLKDLDRAAFTLAEACGMLLDQDLPRVLREKGKCTLRNLRKTNYFTFVEYR